MAARRGKTQARRSGGGNGLPGWAWLVMGVLATLLVVLLAPKLMHREGAGGFFSLGGPRADPDAQPKGSSETDGAFEPVAATRDDVKSSAKAPAKAPAKTDAKPAAEKGSALAAAVGGAVRVTVDPVA